MTVLAAEAAGTAEGAGAKAAASKSSRAASGARSAGKTAGKTAAASRGSRTSPPGARARGAVDKQRTIAGQRFSANDAAGAMLALIAYGPILAWIRGGQPLAKQWFKAKFLNEAGNQKASAVGPLTPQSPDQSTLEGPLGQSLGGGIGGLVGGLSGAKPPTITRNPDGSMTITTTPGGVA